MNKSKFIIKLISAVGAAAIATTCVAGSVGAVKPSNSLTTEDDGETISNIKKVDGLVRCCSELIDGRIVAELRDYLDDDDEEDDDTLGNMGEDIRDDNEELFKNLKDTPIGGRLMVKHLLAQLKGSIIPKIKQMDKLCQESSRTIQQVLIDSDKQYVVRIDLDKQYDLLKDLHKQYDDDDLSLVYCMKYFERCVRFSRDITKEYSNLCAAAKNIEKVEDDLKRKELTDIVKDIKDRYNKIIPRNDIEKNKQQVAEFKGLVENAVNKIKDACENK